MDEQGEQESESVPEDLVQDVLKRLADITKQTQENTNFKNEIARQLKNMGYDFFAENEDGTDPEHVIKILKVAINNTMTIRLQCAEQTEADDNDDEESEKTDETLGKKLERILEINDGKCLDDYFSKGISRVAENFNPVLRLLTHNDLGFLNHFAPIVVYSNTELILVLSFRSNE
jgi:hypothetical protein